MTSWTIGKKLLTTFSIMLALVLGLLLLSVLQARNGRQQLDRVLHQFNRKLEIASAIELATTEMQGAQRGLMLSYEANDASSAPQYIELYKTSGATIDTMLGELAPLATSTSEHASLSMVEESRAEWKPKYDALVALCAAGQVAEAYKLRSQNKVISQNMHTAAKKLADEQRESLSIAESESAASVSRSNWISVAGLLISCLVGFIVYYTVGQITSSLRDTVEELSSGASQIAEGAEHISNSSQALAQGTSEQASSIQETSAATEQITSMTQRNADSAIQASTLMQSTTSIVDEANRSLEQMQVSMNDINASSNKVSNIIKTIDQIAFQTNILALNAAVEAARAGEAGMGFAVVADEVRSLAHRSAEAARNTTVLIEESMAKSNQGRARLELVATSMRAITQSSSDASKLVDEVKAGSAEQSKGIQLIASKITEIDRVTQGSADRAQQGAATGQQMQAQATSLHGIVKKLHSMVG